MMWNPEKVKEAQAALASRKDLLVPAGDHDTEFDFKDDLDASLHMGEEECYAQVDEEAFRWFGVWKLPFTTSEMVKKHLGIDLYEGVEA